jgi:hypothetical protein
MVTNLITNTLSKACQVCGQTDSFLHSLTHFPGLGYILIAFIVVLIFVLIIRNGAAVNIETVFGKIKIPSLKKNNNAVDMCELCKINVMFFITDFMETFYAINKAEQTNSNEQIRELDSQFVIEYSWINNLHSSVVNEKIKLRTNLNESEMTKIFMKNNQILNYIWLIKEREIYDFMKNVILLNTFLNKNATELRYFVHERSQVLAASLESGSNLYPDWDDPELLFKRKEYIDYILMGKIRPRIEEVLLTTLEKCQIIQQKHNSEMEVLKNKKNKIIEELKKSMPPKKKE